MAKLVGIFQFNGKLGEVVGMKGADGANYARTRVVPLNPKTDLQTDQRAKVNLMGRMSQVTPAEVILGLGSNKRYRRAEFNKILLNAATIDRSTPGTVVAKITPDNILFSKGAQAIQASVSTAAEITVDGATLGLTLTEPTLAGMYGERIVVAVIDPSDKAGYSLLKYSDVVFDNTTAQTVSVRYGAPIANESMVCIYRIPFLLTEQGAAMRTETLANNGTDIIAKVLTSGNLVRDWGNSTLATTEVFTQA